MNRTTKRTAKKTFTPSAWQLDAANLTGAGPEHRVQVWSPSGTFIGNVSLERAREIVAAKAAFLGASHYICQVG